MHKCTAGSVTMRKVGPTALTVHYHSSCGSTITTKPCRQCHRRNRCSPHMRAQHTVHVGDHTMYTRTPLAAGNERPPTNQLQQSIVFAAGSGRLAYSSLLQRLSATVLSLSDNTVNGRGWIEQNKVDHRNLHSALVKKPKTIMNNTASVLKRCFGKV